MSQTVIDIAWDRPTIPQIQATGAIGVIRYASSDPTKNLTAAEVTAYHAAGLATGLVWEDGTTRATQGRQAGIDDAHAADAQRAAYGLPADQPVYFAVDEDTDWTSVAAYFAGADSVLGTNAAGLRRTGAYGGILVIDGAAAAGFHYLWQTLAWSGGQRSVHATLYQNGSTVLGGQADINDVLAADWGQYPNPGSGGDIVLDAATLAQIVNGVWNHTEINALDGKSPVRMGAVQAWMDRVHGNQTAAINAVGAAVAGSATALAAVTAAVNKLGTADAALLADLQAAQAALSGIPAQVEAALKDGTVHVDVSVTGPAPTGA
jgi:hypothetical protein